MTSQQKLEADELTWTNWFKKYAARIAQDCSGTDKIGEYKAKRIERLNTNNPR
jgi:hypothetical protein